MFCILNEISSSLISENLKRTRCLFTKSGKIEHNLTKI